MFIVQVIFKKFKEWLLFFKEFKDISVFFKDLRQKIETLNLRQDPGSTPVYPKIVRRMS